MKIFLLSIFMILGMELSAQHKLAIIIGEKALQNDDQLAIKGLVFSRDTTVINAKSPDAQVLEINVPVQAGKVFYDFEIILTRNNGEFISHVKGDFEATGDTFLMLPSPVETVAPDHTMEMAGARFSTNIFLPPAYDKKKGYPHIFFLTWRNDLRHYEKSWWQETLLKNKTEVILTRVDLKVNDSISISKISSLIADTLSGYIRSSYKVLPGKDNFIIAGEGVGATIALATILDYELVFGRSGMFLPLFDGLPEEAAASVKKYAASANGMFFFYTGSQLNETDRKISERIMDELGAGSRSLIYAVEDESGAAPSGDWKKWFPEFYKWVFSNGLNYIIK